MPGNIVPENPEDTFRIYAEGDEPSDWVEAMATAKPGGAGGFSLESSQDTIVITIPANKVRSALLNILGYATADLAAPWELHRPAVPVQHPRYPWLYADGVSVQLMNPLGNTEYTYDSRRDERYAGNIRTQSYYKAKEGSRFGDNQGYMPEYMGRYGRAELTIRFSQVDWPIFKDDDPDWQDFYGPEFEYKRFFGFSNLDPKLDLITAEGGTDASSFYWAETDDPKVTGESPNAGPSGGAFNGAVHIRRNQESFEMIWKTVAEDYVCVGGPTMPNPKRLLAHLGTVNDDWFPGTEEEGGFPPYTLLFDGLKGRRYQLPASVDDPTAVGAYCWDWYLQFSHFDPPRPDAVMDYTNSPIAEASRARGWLLFPERLSRRWFYATSGSSTTRGTYSGNAVLAPTTFTNMFRHVSDDTVPYP